MLNSMNDECVRVCPAMHRDAEEKKCWHLQTYPQALQLRAAYVHVPIYLDSCHVWVSAWLCSGLYTRAQYLYMASYSKLYIQGSRADSQMMNWYLHLDFMFLPFLHKKPDKRLTVYSRLWKKGKKASLNVMFKGGYLWVIRVFRFPYSIPGWASKRGHFLKNSLAPTNKL